MLNKRVRAIATNTMIKLTNTFIFVLLSCFWMACTPDTECRQSSEAFLNVNYYAMEPDEETGFLVAKKVSVDSLNIWGVDCDSVLYNNRKTMSEISLPLQPVNEVSQFVFQYKTLIDTLTIYHSNDNYFVSLECGCYVKHDLTDAFSCKTIIDSIAITNQQVTTFDEEHIQIFF